MTTMERPYFMENKDWYYYDETERKLKIRDDAPAKAKKSYEDFYKSLEESYQQK